MRVTFFFFFIQCASDACTVVLLARFCGVAKFPAGCDGSIGWAWRRNMQWRTKEGVEVVKDGLRKFDGRVWGALGVVDVM